MKTFTLVMTSRQRADEKKEKRKAILRALGEAAMSIVFFILVFGLGLLCAICSGYHWE